MKTILKTTTAIVIIASAVTLTACFHNDDDAASGPAVPANGITITDANAGATMASATLVMSAVTAVETTGGPADVMQLITDRMRDKIKNPPVTGQDPVVGVAFDTTDPCPDGGTIREVGDDGGTGDTGSGSATTTYTGCKMFGVTINGTFTVNWSWNGFPWNASGSGSLTVNDGLENITISGIAVALNGDGSTGEYTYTTFQFTFDPASGGGYAFQVTTPLTGEENPATEVDLGCPTSPGSGILTLSGGGGTQARLTINGGGPVTLEFNDGTGIWATVSGGPYACGDFFFFM